MANIPFVYPFLTGHEIANLGEVLDNRHLHGDGPFTKRCHQHLENLYGAPALLTHSCTAALEVAALLANVGPDDEVIMPSFTFVSTANAFVLRGATPVFVDIRPDTFNLDERLLEQAVTPKTRAIVPVHYAGVSCAMDTINAFAKRHNLTVIEDAAQAIESFSNGERVGTSGHMAAFSFHQTKNVISGEGGAIILNDKTLAERAHILREKGTNRTQFERGAVSKYEWLDVGSSFLPSDLVAAVLLPQLENATALTQKRIRLWNLYHEALAALESKGVLRRPVIPAGCRHNAHIYHVLLNDTKGRSAVIQRLRDQGITATSHYVPLHSSPGGKKFGRTAGSLAVTDRVAEGILRLPLFPDMKELDITRVVQTLEGCF